MNLRQMTVILMIQAVTFSLRGHGYKGQSPTVDSVLAFSALTPPTIPTSALLRNVHTRRRPLQNNTTVENAIILFR